MENKVLLTVSGINKSFGVVRALNNVDITIHAGSIHGLIGENGSGKSTVTSIIAGMQKADLGDMMFKGEKWSPVSMIDALEKGVGMIVQESGTIPGISVAENIFLGELDGFKKLGKINRKALNKAANKALSDLGAVIEAGAITGSLDLESRKLVEIAKVMMKKPDILVVDETTTALSQTGRYILYKRIRELREEGKSVIFISHDLDEIMEVCDTLTVLRDGNIIRTFLKDEFDPDAIRTSMIGRELEGDYYRSDWEDFSGGEISISAKNLSYKNELKDLNIEARRGEILGIGGLSHCGMHALGKCLFGAIKPEKGSVTVNGKPITNENVAMKNKIGYVSKDRDIESLCLSASIKDNISVGGLDKHAVKNVFVLYNKEKKYVKKQIDSLQIKCWGANQEVNQLSGGNKQKVVFGKWIGRESEILILDCPTRGVDIGVKQAMYQLMYELKKQNKTIIMISEEMTELMGMCDRIAIMKDGKLTKEFMRSPDLSDAEIIKYMI